MKPLYTLLCCLMAAGALAQDIQYVDKQGRPETRKKAAAMIVFVRVSDTCWERSYFKKNGPCFFTVQYKDVNATVQHGRYIRYGKDGCADTLGYYTNGKRDGFWSLPGDNCRTAWVLEYDNDKLISVKDSTQLNLERKKRKDSLLAVLKPSDTSEVESEYPGGPSEWMRFLNRNLRYPQEAIDDEVMGQTNVAFVVTPEGNVEDPFIWRSADYYLDKEAIRIIIKSMRWEPAKQFGKKMRSYKIQPLMYRLERG